VALLMDDVLTRSERRMPSVLLHFVPKLVTLTFDLSTPELQRQLKVYCGIFSMYLRLLGCLQDKSEHYQNCIAVSCTAVVSNCMWTISYEQFFRYSFKTVLHSATGTQIMSVTDRQTDRQNW